METIVSCRQWQLEKFSHADEQEHMRQIDFVAELAEFFEREESGVGWCVGSLRAQQVSSGANSHQGRPPGQAGMRSAINAPGGKEVGCDDRHADIAQETKPGGAGLPIAGCGETQGSKSAHRDFVETTEIGVWISAPGSQDRRHKNDRDESSNQYGPISNQQQERRKAKIENLFNRQRPKRIPQAWRARQGGYVDVVSKGEDI